MPDTTTPDPDSEQPYFTTQPSPTPEDVTRRKRAEYQRKYRQRKSARPTPLDVSDSPVTSEFESSTSSQSDGLSTRKQSTRNTRKTEMPTRHTGDKSTLPRMSAEDYASAFQALHMMGAGVSGIPGVAITDEEAAPVGKALKVFADYYGWDPIEKFGPGLLLGFQLTMVEAKVIKRVRQQGPEVRRLKREAKQRQRAPIPEPEIVTPTTPPPDLAEVESPRTTPARQLRALQEIVEAIPENMIPSGIEQGPVA